jgi:hypothetical protein
VLGTFTTSKEHTQMELFFKHASPLTLAGFIADLNQADTTDPVADELRSLCLAELTAIVGPDEANAMLLAAGAAR